MFVTPWVFSKNEPAGLDFPPAIADVLSWLWPCRMFVTPWVFSTTLPVI
jgi:hypothetical protein